MSVPALLNTFRLIVSESLEEVDPTRLLDHAAARYRRPAICRLMPTRTGQQPRLDSRFGV